MINDYLMILVGIAVLILMFGTVLFMTIRSQSTYKKHQKEKQELIARLNKESTKSMSEIRETVMQQISMDIHDNIGSLLSLVSVQLSSLPEYQKSEALQEIAATVKDAVTGMREVIRNLKPSSLKEEGLESSVRKEINRIEATGKFKVNFEVQQEIDNISEGIIIIAYRVIQECLNNIIKHSMAKNIGIGIKRMNDFLELKIQDDGVGFDTERLKTSSGLSHIKARALSIGGTASISSIKGKGTTINISLPIIC